MKLSPPSALVLLCASCAPSVDSVTFRIESSLQLAPPSCQSEEALPRDDATLLDIGFDAESANSAVAVLALDMDDEPLLTITTSETVVRGALDGAPRRFGAGPGIVNEAVQPPRDRVFITLVAREDAFALQEDEAVRAALRNPDDRMRVDVDVVLEAFRSGTGADTNEADRLPPPSSPSGIVRTPSFTLPVDLCAGCLLPRCADDEELVPAVDDGVCFRGQDEPFICAPAVP